MGWGLPRRSLPAISAAAIVSPVLINPWVPRDAPPYALTSGYALRILTGRDPVDPCPYWCIGLPHTILYRFLPHYLIAPVAGLLGGPRAFAVGLFSATILFALATHALARSLGLGRRPSAWSGALAADGVRVNTPRYSGTSVR